jgi:hypothetical protein
MLGYHLLGQKKLFTHEVAPLAWGAVVVPDGII